MVNRKLKFALLTLLGFAPACSTIKTTRSTATPQTADTVAAPGDSLRHMIKLMYGVRQPLPQQEKSQQDTTATVHAYGDTPRRVMTAYGVPSPKDSLAIKPDSTGGFKCIMPPAPKDFDK